MESASVMTNSLMALMLKPLLKGNSLFFFLNLGLRDLVIFTKVLAQFPTFIEHKPIT